MSDKKTVFNQLWLNPTLFPEFSSWVRPVVGNNFQAFCNLCKKTLNLSNMGKQALVSHEKGPTHLKMVTGASCQTSLSTFFLKKSSNAASSSGSTAISDINLNKEQGSDSSYSNTGNVVMSQCTRFQMNGVTKSEQNIVHQRNLNSYILKEDVMKAEIIWSLQVVCKKMSFNSCSNVSTIFKMMFPDSAVANAYTLGGDKVAYVLVHGLAPYFQQNMLDRLKLCDNFVLCFDEALNKVIQRGQMDMIIRFWDEEKQMVTSRYLNSVFFDRSTAEHLLKSFLDGIAPLSPSKIIQVSMDGPNVNLKFFRCLQEHIRSTTSNETFTLLNLGTCSLHVVHGALKTGIESVGWDMSNLLLHLYFLFHDSPARRALFTERTDCANFPLKFCNVRWLDNAKCLKRALEVWDHVAKFVNEAKLPKTKVVKTLVEAARDPFVKCKMAFCKTVADECEPFLKKFQTSKPMSPFLFEAVEKLLRDIMNRCVKPDVMKCTSTRLLSIDVKKSENLILNSKVDVGFAAKRFLAELSTSVTEREKLEFMNECRGMLTAMIAKLQERCPLKFKVVRGLSSLDPSIIQHSPSLGQKRFSCLLEELLTSNKINEDLAENAKKEYCNLCDVKKTVLKEMFNEHCTNEEARLDSIYSNLMRGSEVYKHLWEVVKICLVLSHGNATVEGGFSINKSLLVENLLEKTVIAQRFIQDKVQQAGGIENMKIDKRMLDNVKGARKRYQDYLELEKQKGSEETIKKGNKRLLDQQVKELVEERKRLMKETEEKKEAMEKELKELEKKRALL